MDSRVEGVLDKLTAVFQDRRVTELLIYGSDLLVLGEGATRISASPFKDTAALTEWMQEFAFHCHRRLDPHYPFNGGSVQGRELR